MRLLARSLATAAVALGAFTVAGVADAAPSPTAPTVAPENHGRTCSRIAQHAGDGPVTIPSWYVYNPNCGALHDYCTNSPDKFYSVSGVADFRGPCARHDLCFGGSTAHSTCNSIFRGQLKQQCDARFSSWNPYRYECRAVAEAYYRVVSAVNP